jgi:hypothetical protein
MPATDEVENHRGDGRAWLAISKKDTKRGDG